MIRFPAHSCLYYSQGACLYSEIVNPGWDRACHCIRLEKLMKEWDDYLDRAEVFQLSERTAARIWNHRHQGALESHALCPHMDLQSEGRSGKEDSDCRHLFQGACLLAMPRCSGVCERFVKRRIRMSK